MSVVSRFFRGETRFRAATIHDIDGKSLFSDNVVCDKASVRKEGEGQPFSLIRGRLVEQALRKGRKDFRRADLSGGDYSGFSGSGKRKEMPHFYKVDATDANFSDAVIKDSRFVKCLLPLSILGAFADENTVIDMSLFTIGSPTDPAASKIVLAEPVVENGHVVFDTSGGAALRAAFAAHARGLETISAHEAFKLYRQAYDLPDTLSMPVFSGRVAERRHNKPDPSTTPDLGRG